LVVFLGDVNAHGVPDCAVWILAGPDEPLVPVALPQAAVDAVDVEFGSAHCPYEVGFGSAPRLRDVAQAVGLGFGYALHGDQRA
jgi:hypothetical protein